MKKEAIEKEWHFDFNFSVTSGEVLGRFLEGLQKKEFLGNQIDSHTFFPPKPFYERTLQIPDKWVECDGTGIVEAFTICCKDENSIHYPGAEKRPKAPYVVGVIRVGNSEQCLIHYLSGFGTDDPKELSEKIQIGMKVQPVWARERTGVIFDIEYFEPIK